ncbi:transcriptional regulator with XRE-family HTH domain [Rhizobium herbae]|uniref:Transcriptional regulator with XRE-family HTH domain n=1 Tax=Rhizobium herbae TaxID=508661 RepID=A0ABS4EW79_9HYPH|nr:transcriptional regulator with XRE-family HTH domain [Rhizobium herbae]
MGIGKASLANYERGDRIPDSDVLASYRAVFNIDINWVVTGKGAMFEADRDRPPGQVNAEILEILTDSVQRIYLDLGQKPPARRLSGEAVRLYNDLVAVVDDVNDKEEVMAVLPQVELRLKRRLQQATAEPGTGKRSA